MTRNLTASEINAAVAQSGSRPAVAIKAEFDSGTVRIWSGLGNFTLNAEVYQGVGALGKLSAAVEGVDIRPFGMSFELSGIDPSTISLALTENTLGRRVTIWNLFRDESNVLIGNGAIIFRGRLDGMSIRMGKNPAVIVRAENRLIDWDRARIRRFTDEDQRIDYPTDRFFEFVPEVTNKEIVWGRKVAGGKGGGTVADGGGNPGKVGTRQFENDR